jgi:hypothetical protein
MLLRVTTAFTCFSWIIKDDYSTWWKYSSKTTLRSKRVDVISSTEFQSCFNSSGWGSKQKDIKLGTYEMKLDRCHDTNSTLCDFDQLASNHTRIPEKGMKLTAG